MPRRILDGITSRALRQEIFALRETLGDSWRYQRVQCRGQAVAEARYHEDRHEECLTKDYNRVEKSLTLPDPRRPLDLAVRISLAERRATE